MSPETPLLLELGAFLRECERFAERMSTDPPQAVDEAGAALDLLRQARQMCSDAERFCEAALAEAMTDDMMVVEGVGALERKFSAVKPRWDAERLLPMIAALSRDERILDESTGVIEGESEAALRVLAECAAISYFRVGALKKRGIEAKDFREQEGWKASVRVVKP